MGALLHVSLPGLQLHQQAVHCSRRGRGVPGDGPTPSLPHHPAPRTPHGGSVAYKGPRALRPAHSSPVARPSNTEPSRAEQSGLT